MPKHKGLRASLYGSRTNDLYGEQCIQWDTVSETIGEMMQSKEVSEVVVQSMAAQVAEKRVRFERLAIMNASSDEAERVRQQIALGQAQADFYAARDALTAAIREELTTAPASTRPTEQQRSQRT